VSDAGRVIAGSAKGIRLTAPSAEGTRPLTDRVKQTLFAILEPYLEGARVLDLFAGSGGAGIEALSRGAAEATFVEHDRRTAGAIRQNLRRTRLTEKAHVRATTVDSFLAAPSGGPFDLVFLDPPYEDVASLRSALAALGAPIAPLADGARVVAKHFWRDAPPARIGLLASERDRRFGETALTFYRRIAEGSQGG
jgi:16S rRNA (guanine966-N2)-methyltransferase